jgi:pantetheine-phosphate adenylyltransferase
MQRIALYTGSFDPPTNGHLDVMKHASALCDVLYIGVGVHPGKTPLFTPDERCAMLEKLGENLPNCVVKAITYDDLAVNAARRLNASLVIRGLRDGTDLDYEIQMAGMNAVLAPEIQTIFLPASPAVRPITATLVRQIALMKGDVTAFVPEIVATALSIKLKG